MACNLFNDPICSQILSSPAAPLSPSTLAELQQLFSSGGLNNNFTQICNNIQNFGTDCDNSVTVSEISLASEVSFNLAVWLRALSKAVKFDSAMAGELENRIDQVWSKNDEALAAAGFTMPDMDGVIGPIVPYNSNAVPPSYDINTPHCGWSRWAQPGLLDPSEPANRSARARIEVLTDGLIISAMLAAIQCLKECATTNQAKIDGWLNKIKCVIDAHIPACVIDGNLTPIDPDISGTSETVTGTGIIDVFGNIIPMNQQAIFIEALLRYEECSGDMSYNARDKAARFNVTINENQFYQVGGVDRGWYYNLKPNSQEVPEDFGHSAITFQYLKYAAQIGVYGARDLLNRMLDSLIDNSYQNNGYFAWYNDGNTGHGSTQGVFGGFIDWGPMGSNTTFTGSTGTGAGTSNVSYYHAWLLSELPPEANVTHNSEISAALNAFVGDNPSGNANVTLAKMCLSMDNCGEVATSYSSLVDPNPYNTTCVDCASISVNGVLASYQAGNLIQFTINNYNEQVTVKTGGQSVATLVANANGTYSFQLPVGCSPNSIYSFVIERAGCVTCTLFATTCSGGTNIGTDPTCYGTFNCSVNIQRQRKDENITEIDFGYEEVCVDFGKSSETSILPDSLNANKNFSCGINAKTCISPHETCFVWCNLCLDDTAIITNSGDVNGSSQNLCECEDGLYWRFVTRLEPNSGILNPALYNVNVTGDDNRGKYADTIIIWDHDLCNEHTNVIELFVDGAKIDDFVVDPKCKHCCGNNGECSPVYMYLKEGAIGKNWTLKFFTKSGYIHSIGNITMGVSFPIDLYAGFQNIFNASRYKRLNQGTECGWTPSVLKDHVYEMNIELTDLEESWFMDYWDDFIWYADRYPFYFIFSKNNRPELISRVRLTEEGVQATEYTDEICQSLEIPLIALRHPQTKDISEAFACPVSNDGLMEIPVKARTTSVLTYTDLTGRDLNSAGCYIIEGSAQFTTNRSLNTANTAVNNEVFLEVGTGPGVTSTLEYTVQCGNFKYPCQVSILAV